jgi:DNA-binding NtrC family response regulator
MAVAVGIPEMTPDNRPIAAEPASRGCVLVVDDEPLIRWSVAETLKQHGYRVVEAGDAEGARGAAGDLRAPFVVAVLDIRLPDSDGLGLLMQLRRMVPGIQIIMMTAHGSAELAAEALKLGAYSVLNKPFGMADVAGLVDRARFEYESAPAPSTNTAQVR